jgi:hypothetical protein
MRTWRASDAKAVTPEGREPERPYHYTVLSQPCPEEPCSREAEY